MNSAAVSFCVNNPEKNAKSPSADAKTMVPDSAMASVFCMTYLKFPFRLTQKNLKRFAFSDKKVFKYGATSIKGANA